MDAGNRVANHYSEALLLAAPNSEKTNHLLRLHLQDLQMSLERDAAGAKSESSLGARRSRERRQPVAASRLLAAQLQLQYVRHHLHLCLLLLL